MLKSDFIFKLTKVHPKIYLSLLETVLTIGVASNLSSPLAATYAEPPFDGEKKRKEILFRASRALILLLLLLLLNCFNTEGQRVLSLCVLQKPFWSQAVRGAKPVLNAAPY